MSRLPNVVFIGAPKTGSTWLHRMLEAHPECYTVPGKGVDFFDKHWERGAEWYASCFRHYRDETIAIDISHDYVYDAASPRRIEQLLPTARLIVFLREPLERLESAVQFAIRSGYRLGSLEDVRRTPLLLHSHYAAALHNWTAALQAGTLQVFFYDELHASPRDFWSRIAHYLGVSVHPVSELAAERQLPASSARYPRVNRTLRRGANLVQQAGDGRLIHRLKRSDALNKALFKQTTPADYFHFTDAERAAVVESFREDVHQLDVLLRGDVRHRWPVYWS